MKEACDKPTLKPFHRLESVGSVQLAEAALTEDTLA